MTPMKPIFAVLVDVNVDQVLDWGQRIVGSLLQWSLTILAIALAGYMILQFLKRRRRKPLPAQPDLTIDVTSLPDLGPPASGPELQFFNVPVRLAVLVVAPVGRVSPLPPAGELHGLLDEVSPGLSIVVASHQPLLRRWPGQVSVRGFAHQFFTNLKLPGRGGKGSPYSAAAGIFKLEDRPVMIGMAFRSATPTSIGQHVVEEQARWLTMLQIR